MNRAYFPKKIDQKWNEEERPAQREGIIHERGENDKNTIGESLESFLELNLYRKHAETRLVRANSASSSSPWRVGKLKINGSVVRYTLYPSAIFFLADLRVSLAYFPSRLMKVRFNVPFPKIPEHGPQMVNSFFFQPRTCRNCNRRANAYRSFFHQRRVCKSRYTYMYTVSSIGRDVEN